MIFDLKHITVKEFYSLEEEEAQKYIKLETMLKVRDDRFLKHKATALGELTWGEVGTIKQNLSESNFDALMECFKIVYGIKKNAYLMADIVEYFYAMKYIKSEILRLINNQKKVFKAVEKDYFMKMAGVERLDVFGDFATLIILGRSFGVDPEIIENWKYNKVFSILAYDKIHSEVQKRYQELKYKK